MTPADLVGAAQSLLPDTIALRRHIHQHPELGNQLPHTRATVLKAIADLDLAVELSQRTSGLVATLRGALPGRTLLLRADMDALPLTEDTGLEFASQIPGCMHACGHDAHTAMLVAAARLLAARRERLRGNVKFMFQPGEEGPGGAAPMIEEGLLDRGGHPDGAFAIHVFPNLPAGVVAGRTGALLAATDTIRVKLIGRGGHASTPSQANDPVPVACELVSALQTFITRRVNPFDPAVLTIGKIQAGSANNVIPDIAALEGTVRTFSEQSRMLVLDGLRRLAQHIAAAHEMRVECEIGEGYPATRNDAGFSELVRAVVSEILGQQAYYPMQEPHMGAEDFSLVLQRYPGAMAFLGVAPEGVDPRNAPTIHTNRMVLNEAALAGGIALHAAVAWRFLQQP